MAEIQNLSYSTLSGPTLAKGLILGNKEGFYRDLGADIFNNSDYVRIVLAVSFNLLSAYNTGVGYPAEDVTNNTINEGFFIGFKTPNALMPTNELDASVKFAGLWSPPMIQNNYYTGYIHSSRNYGGLNGESYWGVSQLFGTITQPAGSFQRAVTGTNVGTLGAPCQFYGTSATYVSYIGLEITSGNVLNGVFNNAGDSQGASYAAMKNFINNTPFTTTTRTLTSSVYGNATSIFVYNPLNTTCLRVHGMMAAGFNY